MAEERHDWRALPPALLLGLGLTAVEAIVMVVSLHVGQYGPPPWVVLANSGIEAAGSALCAYGAAELAQRHTGMQRRGLQIASATWFAALALQFVWLAMSVLRRSPWSAPDDGWIMVGRYGWFAVGVLPTIAIAIATLRRHRVLAVVSVVIAVASHPPPFAVQRIWNWLALGYKNFLLLEGAVSLLGLALLAALVVALAPATTLPEPGRAAVGLRRAGAGLRIRMVGVVVSTATMLVTLGNPGGSAFALTLVGAAINAAAFGWLAFGLLGAAREGELSRTKLVLAGATSLWCAAVELARLVYGYVAMYGASGSEGRDMARAHLDTLVLGIPLVAFVGVVILAAELGPFVVWARQGQPGEDEVIAGSAARRREHQLSRDPTGQLTWIILLMLASAAIQGWVMSHAYSRSDAGLLILMATGCSLVALTMIARLCSTAAKAFEGEPGLPAARVIGAG